LWNVLDHVFVEEDKSKRKQNDEKLIQMSGFSITKTLDDFKFSFQPSIDKRQNDELATMRLLESIDSGIQCSKLTKKVRSAAATRRSAPAFL